MNQVAFRSEPARLMGRWKVNAWQIPAVLRDATTFRARVEAVDFILADVDGALVLLCHKVLVAEGA